MVALSLAKKNILRKQERSLLTIIGVILAVGSFVSLLSIAEGLNQRLQKEVSARRVDIYILPSSTISLPTGPIGAIGSSTESITIEQNIPDEPILKPVKPAEFKKLPKHKGNMLDFLNSPPDGIQIIPNIKKAIGVTRLQQNINNKSVVFWGIPFDQPDQEGENTFKQFFPSALPVEGMLPVPAQQVEDPYCTELRRKAEDLTEEDKTFVCGSKIAQELNINTGTPLFLKSGSDKIELKPCGIASFKAGFQDYFCYIPIQTALTLEDSPGKVKEIWIQLENPGKTAETKKIIQINFPDLVVKTSAEYQGASGELVKYAWLLQFAIALIGILIATTASMNTMLMSAFERVREFGALRAIGASRTTISSMIFIESLILSVTGGIAGIVVGILGSHFLDGAVKILFQTVFPLAHITFNLIIYALGLSLMIGIAGAIIPAVIIYRMDIIKSLKWE